MQPRPTIRKEYTHMIKGYELREQKLMSAGRKIFWHLSRGLRFVVGYYMFDISFKNLVQGIPLSGARTPREGGLIDSRRHVRARAHRLWRQRGAFLSG